jgi:hypothetical protein|nr:hypothetical protein [uncultured Comamonas sp.]
MIDGSEGLKNVEAKTTPGAPATVSALSQKLLLEAGYQPKGEWVYIEDLIQKYQNSHKSNHDLLQEVKSFLSDSIIPITRAEFVNFTATLANRENEKRKTELRSTQLQEILATAGVTHKDAGHEALALRIHELECAVEAYAQKLKSSDSVTCHGRASGAVPFLAGVMIGGILF